MPRKQEPKLTKKQLREKAKREKLEQELKLKQEQEALIAEERRKREEELERIRQAELKYRQEEALRLKDEQAEYLSFQIAFLQSKEKALKAFLDSEEWTAYSNCEQRFDVSKESDVNLLITLLLESRVFNEASLEALLDKIDQSLDAIKRLNLKILELFSSENQNKGEIRNCVEMRQRIFSAVEQKISDVHYYVLQVSEGLVSAKIAELKANQSEIQGKQGKPAEIRPEVQLEFDRANFALGYYIMAFENSGIKPTPIHFRAAEMKSDVPKAFFSKRFTMLAVRLSSSFLFPKGLAISETGGECDREGLGDFWPLSSSIEVSCLNCLQDSKAVSDFSIKLLPAQSEALAKLAIPKSEGSSSNFKVYVFPDKNTFLEENSDLALFYFDSSKKCWSRENVGQIKFEENEQLKRTQLVVSVPLLAPMIVAEPIRSNFPFKQFKLEPLPNGAVRLDIQSLKIELSFEVGPGRVSLIESTAECLLDLEQRELRPHEMLIALAEKNVLLMPEVIEIFTQLDKKKVNPSILNSQDKISKENKEELKNQIQPENQTELNINNNQENDSKDFPSPLDNENKRGLFLNKREFKNLSLEEYCLREVTKHSRRLSIRLSKWNSKAGKNNVVLKIREPYSEEEKKNPAEIGAWKQILMSDDKCELLELEDLAGEFSSKRKEGTVSHLNLFLLVKTYPHLFNYFGFAEEMTEKELLVIDTLQKFLRPIKLFAYSD